METVRNTLVAADRKLGDLRLSLVRAHFGASENVGPGHHVAAGGLSPLNPGSRITASIDAGMHIHAGEFYGS